MHTYVQQDADDETFVSLLPFPFLLDYFDRDYSQFRQSVPNDEILNIITCSAKDKDRLLGIRKMKSESEAFFPSSPPPSLRLNYHLYLALVNDYDATTHASYQTIPSFHFYKTLSVHRNVASA